MDATADDLDTRCPLVLLPGTLCDARVFAPLMERLPPRRISIGDMAGLASTRALAGRLLERAPPVFALIGFSLGAIVALEVAAQVPGRVAGLALIGGNAHAPTAPDVARRRAEIAAVTSVERYVGETMWPSYVADQGDERLRRTLIDMGRDGGHDALRLQTEVALSRADSRPRLGALTMPTLVLAGAADAINDATVQRRLAAAIPAATLVLVPGAGHFVLLERPAACARAVIGWLGSVDDGSAFDEAPLAFTRERS
ncbi:alpha/beta fold hydrolase [Sphingomonas bacterium]|uniref:alpha/beta fold hydrolase n=1 Tax=Sphingomonas bacterium TaxID=1895847 RepID=UPI00157503A1|nr:alpha/beta hydrolase [Sphingomonas bacterium]